MNKALVTGATSGLGKAIAEAFLEAGKIVYVHGRSKRGISELLKHPNCHFFELDLRNLDELSAFSDLLRRDKIDCFVSNAGIYSSKGISSSPRKCLDILNTNFVAPVLILREVYSHFCKLGGGTIVSINSISGIYPNFDEAVYCASKFGLKGFIKALQIDAYKHNVRVFDYYPAAMKTRMTRDREGFDRFIEPGDIAALVVANVTSTATFIPVYQELRRNAVSAE